jgi:hypothetical protein
LNAPGANYLALGPLNGNAIKSKANNELGKCSCVIDDLKNFDNVCKDYPIERPQSPTDKAVVIHSIAYRSETLTL